MTPEFQRFAPVGSLLLLATLAGCGGGDDTTSTAAPVTAPMEATGAPEASALAERVRAAFAEIDHDATGEADALGLGNAAATAASTDTAATESTRARAAAVATPAFLPTVFRPEPPTLQKTCATAPVTNASATLARVWFAQTHLMEVGWPFFNLVQDRGALLKLDVTGPTGARVPQISVTARWTGGSATRCLVAPTALPTTVDTRTQPLNQTLATSYRATLPSAWMRPDTTLTIAVAGGATRTFTPAQLKLATKPQAEMVLVDTLLFGDTTPRPTAAMRAEFAARFPFTSMAFYNWPQPLSLPKLVISPRSDGQTAFGVAASQPAVWADRLPSCTTTQKTAGTCTLYGGFGVLAATRSLTGKIQNANGMYWTGIWYAGHGANSGVGGGLGGGLLASGDNYAQIFNHEIGHSLSLPHLGGVTGANQTSATGLRDPYTGETKSGATFNGGGFGKTTGYDPLDNTLMHWGCNGTQVEAQDPMQRGCNNVATGRVFDHFSDFSTVQMQRYWTGAATALGGTVPYWSSFIAGSSSTAPAATAYYFPTQGGTVQAEWGTAATPTLRRLNTATGAHETVLRPPGDDGFVKTLPTAAAGTVYDRYYDFRFPLQRNVPVISVYGAFNYTNDATSAVLGVVKTNGHLKRLWDPTDATTFNLMKQSISGDTFWWGWNLHLKVEYSNGTFRYVAMDNSVSATTDPMSGFTYWAVNLPDDGRTISRLTLMHRPLCVRNGAASDRSCDIGVAANSITAANVYSTAKIATVWVP